MTQPPHISPAPVGHKEINDTITFFFTKDKEINDTITFFFTKDKSPKMPQMLNKDHRYIE